MNFNNIVGLIIDTRTGNRHHREVKNKVTINFQDSINEVSVDQNGMLTQLRSYSAPQTFNFKFNPDCFSPRHLSRHLREFISNRWACQTLKKRIASHYDSLPKPLQPVHIFVEVKVIKEIRVPIPSDDPRNVLERLCEEQKVDLMDLGQEEQEAICSICMEEFLEPSSGDLIKMPKCLHLFHEHCIFEWLKLRNSCPLCRQLPYEDECENPMET